MGSVKMTTKAVVVNSAILHILRKYSFSCNTLVITFFLQCVSRRQNFILKLLLIQNVWLRLFYLFYFILFIYFFLIEIHSIRGSTATRRHEFTRKRSTKRSGFELRTKRKSRSIFRNSQWRLWPFKGNSQYFSFNEYSFIHILITIN